MVWLCVPRGCDGSSRRASQYLMGSWLGFPSYCSSSSKQAVFPWLQTWASTSLCWAILHKRNVKASLILQQGEAVSQLSSHWSLGAHSLSPSLSDYKSTSARWPPHFVSPSGYILSFSKTLALWMGLVMAVPGSYSSLTARNGNRAPHPCLTPLSFCRSHAMPVSKGKGVMGRRRSKQKWSVWSPVGAQPGDWGPDTGTVPSWILGLPCLGRNGVCFASPAL